MPAEKDRPLAAILAHEDVLAFVAHDLRSPLMGIVMAAETLLQGGDIGDQGKRGTHLERIRRGAQQMQHMIDEMLDLASLDAGRLTVVAEVNGVARILEELT